MKIRSLETFNITLPFRISFGHALASRDESKNLIVKITLDNGICGYGEGVPRDYVTGETLACAEENVLLKYAPQIMGLSMDNPTALVGELRAIFRKLDLHQKAQGASWCALEIAVLDALSRLHGMKLFELIGKRKQEKIRYGGTIPFAKKGALEALLYFYKFYGFQTVKIKVGSETLADDLANLRIARNILGKDCILRVDANCAWTLEEALAAAEAFRPLGVASYEQPLPADKWEDLQKLSNSIEEDVIVDESLCTLKQAEELASNKICNAFNIRVSKVGGLFAGQEMIDIAKKHNLRVHLGAQVGESGILSAAARHLAIVNEPMENYEGSANFFLLKKDICSQNLNAGPGGYGNLNYGKRIPGLGLSILEGNLNSMTETSEPLMESTRHSLATVL